MNDTLLNVKQIAKQLGYCEKTVRRKFKQGRLPGAIQVGGTHCQIKMPLSVVLKIKAGV